MKKIILFIFADLVLMTQIAVANDDTFTYGDYWQTCHETDLKRGYPTPEVDVLNDLVDQGKRLDTVDVFYDQWRKHFDVLHQKIPEPSPREREWVESERQKMFTNYESYKRLTKTTQYALTEVYYWVHESRFLLEKIKSTSGVERKFNLIHFGYRVSDVPEEQFRMLRTQGIIPELNDRQDGSYRLKGYEDGFIPNVLYGGMNAPLKAAHRHLGLSIAKCFLVNR